MTWATLSSIPFPIKVNTTGTKAWFCTGSLSWNWRDQSSAIGLIIPSTSVFFPEDWWRVPKVGVPQIIQNSTILVLKPMVFGILHFKKPHMQACFSPIQSFSHSLTIAGGKGRPNRSHKASRGATWVDILTINFLIVFVEDEPCFVSSLKYDSVYFSSTVINSMLIYLVTSGPTMIRNGEPCCNKNVDIRALCGYIHILLHVHMSLHAYVRYMIRFKMHACITQRNHTHAFFWRVQIPPC